MSIIAQHNLIILYKYSFHGRIRLDIKHSQTFSELKHVQLPVSITLQIHHGMSPFHWFDLDRSDRTRKSKVRVKSCLKSNIFASRLV